MIGLFVNSFEVNKNILTVERKEINNIAKTFPVHYDVRCKTSLREESISSADRLLVLLFWPVGCVKKSEYTSEKKVYE